MRPGSSGLMDGLCYATDPRIDISPATLGVGTHMPTISTTIHTFHVVDSTVWEVAAATIHPTADQTRATPPQGWFIVAQRFDANALTEISTLLNSEVTLEWGSSTHSAADQNSNVQRIYYPLNDLTGTPVATLIMTNVQPLVAELWQTTTETLLLVITMNLLTFGFLRFGLSRSVVAPLSLLVCSLQDERPAALDQLAHERGEFGQLASLVQNFFAQREVLAQEVAAHNQAEATLRSFFDNTGVMMGIVELTADDILHIADNTATASFFHTTVANLHGQYARRLGVPPEVLASWISAYRASEQSGMPIQFNYPHETATVHAWLSATVSCIGPAANGRIRYSYVVTDITERVAMETELRASQERLAAANAQLYELAHTDSLTDLHNRAAFDEWLHNEITRATRYQHPLSLLLLDIDLFKPYNDTYGHVAGDQVLRSAAHIFQAQVRQNDVVARYGGEEFAVILPNTDAEVAIVVAERIREGIECAAWPQRAITISIGVATYNPSAAAEQFIMQADAALYRAKGWGRNCVVHVRQSVPDQATPVQADGGV